MVTRKPVGSGSRGPAAASSSHMVNPPPYPTSPTLPNFEPIDTPEHALNDDGFIPPSRSSSVSSHGTWNSGFSEDDGTSSPSKDAPAAPISGPSESQVPESQIPDILRPGLPSTSPGPPQVQPNPWASEELQGREPVPTPPHLQSRNPHNPYLRAQNTGNNPSFNSQAAWGEPGTLPPPSPFAPPPPPPFAAAPYPPLPETAPPPPPFNAPPAPPTNDMAAMSLGGYHPPTNQTPYPTSEQTPYNLPQGLQAPLTPLSTGFAKPPIERQLSGASSNPWQDDVDRKGQSPTYHENMSAAPALPALTTHEPLQMPHVPFPSEQSLRNRDSNLISFMDDEIPTQPQESHLNSGASPSRPSDDLLIAQSYGPRLTPSSSPSRAPKPSAISIAPPTLRRISSSSNQPETPNTRARRQRNETYQIKQIRWFDSMAGPTGSMRSSPIMTQNANGPCPLLALVNALTLSTPENVQTALVDALHSREQVSLGLLLDAVFEELARRSELNDKELPDVGDLYSFLITLHTGMNVNPRFVLPGAPHIGSVAAEVPTSSTMAKPGVFEETREMVLYSTFGVPLIHGWIPPPDSAEYAAFDRSAKTFDDALNMQFREQELEDKLQSVGLSPEEQQLYEDIALGKQFLESYPTQLSEHGLQVMARVLNPGQIAILFRNDHFSTLYKNPKTGVLNTLVTDAGYASHDEIVWETLVDISGAAGELLSGDFRPVGNTSNSVAQQNSAGNRGTIYAPPAGPPPGFRGSSTEDRVTDTTGQQFSPHEQEDHDLALALQLQEEEEDNERRAASARRRQEDELSRQFLDREGHSARRTSSPASPSDSPANRPRIPPRRPNTAGRDGGGAASPSVDAPYIRAQENDDDQPPSYEQAASDRLFRPAGSQPRGAGRQGDALGALNAITAQQRAQEGLSPNSAYAAHSHSSMSVNSYNGSPGSLGGRRRSGGMGTNSGAMPTNRMRRTQSSVAGTGIYGQRVPGDYPGNASNAAPGSRSTIEQERCVIM